MAAVLASGKRAVASHRSAAHRLGIVPAAPALPEVTAATTAPRRRPGIFIHRVRALPSLDAAVVYGIPITTVPRTLLDLAPTLAPADLARACHEAWIRHRTTPGHVAACVARNPGKPGAARLRRALGADVTLSALEDDFLALLRPATGCRRRARTSTATATGSTATGRERASPSSSCPTATTRRVTASSRTSRGGGARTTSRSPSATSTSAATRRSPSSVSGCCRRRSRAARRRRRRRRRGPSRAGSGSTCRSAA